MPHPTPAEIDVPLTPHSTVRERFAAATLWLPVLAISVTATLWYDSLPAVLPRQWSGSEVTSTSGTEVMIGVTGSIALLGAIVGLVALSDAAAEIRRVLLLAAGFAAGLAASTWLVIAGLVMVTGSPEPAAGAWPVLAVVGSGYGVLPFALSPRRAQSNRTDASAPAVTVPLGATETGAWFTTVTVPVFVWVATLAALGAVALGVFSVVEGGAGASAVVTLALVTVISLTFARLRVSVDRRGLRVVSSLLRLPLKQIPLDQITSVRAESVRPMDWGGWGYRILPGRSAIVLSGGQGIAVTRRNGTEFVVTVPEAELPAALLSTLAAR